MAKKIRKITANAIVREALAETGMYRWELADLLGCSVETVQRRLRHELPVEEQHRIATLIRENASGEDNA